MLNECWDCPKEESLKIYCTRRDYPHSNAKVIYLNKNAKCELKEKLEKIKEDSPIK